MSDSLFLTELTTSKIAPIVAASATYIEENLSHEVYDLLGRKLTINGYQVPHDFGQSLVFANEDQLIWQIKPSNPIIGKNGRAQKYMCPTGSATGPYLPAVPQQLRTMLNITQEGAFWDAIEADPSRPIVLTEGGKKALSLLSHGTIAIALVGCDGSTIKVGDHSELDPRLARFFNGNRKITIAMDSDNDPRTTARVGHATDKLAARIAAHCPTCIVKVAKWEPKDGKGVDDVIAQRGIGFMEDVLKGAKRLSISPMYLALNSPDAIYTHGKFGTKLKAANHLADIVSLALGNTIAFDLETSQFWQYEQLFSGVWSPLLPAQIRGLVDRTLQSLTPETCIVDGDTHAVTLDWTDTTVRSVVNLMEGRTIGQKIGIPYDAAARDADGNRMPRLVPMMNGVLNVETRELLPHSPLFGHTNRLPYAYSAVAKAPTPILEFFNQTQEGDEVRVQVLRAFLRCLITGQAPELNRFLEVVGLGGTGKSTFAKLCVAMVGKENTATTTFEAMANQFEAISFKGKLLIQVPDAEVYVSSGALSLIRALSGGDIISAEQKYQAKGRGFTASGMVMITANEPFKSRESITASAAGAITRRRATVPFNVQVDRSKMDRDLINISENAVSGTFAQHLPGLFNWALDMSQADMVEFVTETERVCPSMMKQQEDVAMATNPLLQWASENLIFGSGLRAAIGGITEVTIDTPEGRILSYLNADSHLYPNYVRWCRQTGVKSTSQRRFSENLEACLQNDLGHKDIERRRFNNASTFFGVAIGIPADETTEESGEPEAVIEDFVYEEAQEQLEVIFHAPASLTEDERSPNLGGSTEPLDGNGKDTRLQVQRSVLRGTEKDSSIL